jgi:hypothetical protein
MGGDRKYDIYEQATKNRGRLSIPHTFSSLTEARESLIFHWHQHTKPKTNEIVVGDEASLAFFVDCQNGQKSSVDTLYQWSKAFDSFLETHGDSLSQSDKHGATMLQMQHDIGFMSLQLNRTLLDDQTGWDQFIPLFNQVVSLAEEIIDHTPKTPRYPSFSLDMGVVGPLYLVSSRCRDPIIRRKAISLLKSRCMQEGVWNSIVTAKVAERVVEIEEAGLGEVKSCSDVPDWARLSFVCPRFDHARRRAVVTYMRRGSRSKLSRRTRQEVVEW